MDFGYFKRVVCMINRIMRNFYSDAWTTTQHKAYYRSSPRSASQLIYN